MSRYKQGSAHIIIIIILILAILGTLGFIFWQNILNKTSDDTKQTAKTTTPTSTVTQTGFVVTRWGIRVPVEGMMLNSENENQIYLSTQAIIDAAKKAGCPSDTQFGYIDKVADKTDSPSYVPMSTKINGYYYGFWSRSQAACVDSQGNAAEPLNSLMMDAENALKTAILNTTSL
jgi:hypothetical protein